MVAIVAIADGLALGVLALVPLAGALGLADLEIPASAVFGWLIVTVPLATMFSAVLARPLRIAVLQRPVFVQTAVCLGVFALMIVLTAAATSWIGAVDTIDDDAELAKMRGFALAAAALYAMNLLALWRPLVAGLSNAETDDGRSSPTP